MADFDFMGYSLRTPDWRYTVWVPMDGATERVDWTRPVFDELYAVSGDVPFDFDFAGYAVNVAAAHADVVEELRGELRGEVESWY